MKSFWLVWTVICLLGYWAAVSQSHRFGAVITGVGAVASVLLATGAMTL